MSESDDEPLLSTQFGTDTTADPANGAAGLNGTHKASARGKLFSCPIHDFFYLSAAAVSIIDTPHFQRLRGLKQLGTTSYVFPTAVHTRFEHSLGVAYKAKEFAYRLFRAQKHELGVTKEDLLCVELAGLCHDLGHGPFSHVFEKEILPRLGIREWDHEIMSQRLLDDIIDTGAINEDDHDIVSSERALIQALMTGDRDACPAKHTGKKFLFDIVANKRNNIDVDKMDYLARDCSLCNTRLSTNINRICSQVKVIDDEVCFKHSEYMTIAALFQDRAQMHRSVYAHRKSKICEFMVTDALIAAEPALQLGPRLRSGNLRDFLTMDDSVLQWIKWQQAAGGSEHQRALDDACAILDRLHTRDLYMFVDEAIVPEHVWAQGKAPQPTPEELLSHCDAAAVAQRLTPEDLIVSQAHVDWCDRNKNPMDNVSFFTDRDSSVKYRLPQDTITSMLPRNFSEHKLRVYCRVRDAALRDVLQKGFKAWLRKHFCIEHTATPSKPSLKRRRLSGGPSLPRMNGGGSPVRTLQHAFDAS